MNGLGDVPAWVWQVLGAACGLGLGLWLGAIRRRRLRLARAVVAEVLPRSSAARIGPSTVMPAAAPASPAAGEAAGSRPMPLGPVATRPAA
ncbi:hypothetical protein G3A44_19425, partial [Ideonella sp. TBM-1]